MKKPPLIIWSSKKDLIKNFDGDIICFIGFNENKFWGLYHTRDLDKKIKKKYQVELNKVNEAMENLIHKSQKEG